MVKVMIATPLEEELVRYIERVDDRVKMLYEPSLLPPPRYPSDHRGRENFRRDASGESRWARMLGEAEVLFGIPDDSPKGLAQTLRASPRLRWIQATSAGAGQQVRVAGLPPEDLNRVTITTASGVHSTPLAEFCLLGLLALVKGLPRLLRDKEEKRWDHYPVRELAGRTVLVVGLGNIGLEVARLARCLGMRTIGLKRRPKGDLPGVDEVHSQEHLKELVPRADDVVVTLPLTPETEGLIDRETVALMKRESVFINVGRGGVVDEEALVEALKEQRILGAALDVFSEEPLPQESPLWELPNVLLSPHTAALSATENERIVRLFAENLRLFLTGKPLINAVDQHTLY